jgi:hypothetical protein
MGHPQSQIQDASRRHGSPRAIADSLPRRTHGLARQATARLECLRHSGVISSASQACFRRSQSSLKPAVSHGDVSPCNRQQLGTIGSRGNGILPFSFFDRVRLDCERRKGTESSLRSGYAVSSTQRSTVGNVGNCCGQVRNYTRFKHGSLSVMPTCGGTIQPPSTSEASGQRDRRYAAALPTCEIDRLKLCGLWPANTPLHGPPPHPTTPNPVHPMHGWLHVGRVRVCVCACTWCYCRYAAANHW